LSSQGPHQLVFGDRRDRQGVGSGGAEAVEDEGKVVAPGFGGDVGGGFDVAGVGPGDEADVLADPTNPVPDLSRA
jgi:hypothetical protein